MFDFSEAQIDISEDEILSKVSEYQIFKYYCKNFQEIDKSFLSELYYDTNPSCRIYIGTNNRLYYKDFGTGDYYNCFDYISRKYNTDYYSALRIVANDFKIKNLKIDISPSLIVSNDIVNIPQKPKIKSRIEIVSQNYNSTDYDYWMKYKIPFDLLHEYNVFSAKFVYLYTSKGTVVYEYRKSNPIYAYRFTNGQKYSYKIYFPYANKKKKWLFSGGSQDDIQGYDQLDLSGDFIILTKSLKDCMCYRLFGINAISLQAEANKLSNDLVIKLKERFKKIIINYDNDDQGIKSTNSLVETWNFEHFYIDGAKDLSDLIADKGIEVAKNELENKLGMKLNYNKKYVQN